MSELPDLQSAVRRLPGVATATVRWPDPQGPATLHVEFTAEADRERVTDAVLETVRRYANVQAEQGEGDPHDATAGRAQQPQEGREPAAEQREAETPSAPPPMVVMSEPSAQQGSPVSRARPVFTGMTVDRGELETVVEVTLAVGDDALVGRAEGLATLRSVPRTAATATLTALRTLLPSGMRAQLDWLEVIEGSGPGRPDIVSSAVTCLSRRGEEVFVGSAIVRNDIREAAVRATLDALNRRLEQSAGA